MMKLKTNLLLFFFAIASCILYSCKKTETIPVEGLTPDLVYDPLDQQGTNAKRVLNDLYSYLPNGFNRIDNAMLDAATDDAIPSIEGKTIEILGLGLQSPSSTVDDTWARNYEAIRKANTFLANIDIVPVTPSNPLTKTNWKAEARFIRAMAYFELVKRYGGVPLLGDRVFETTDDIQIARNTFAEAINYIVAECDAIITLLPAEPLIDTDLGRATPGAAMALKARALLYDASPLNNTSNDLNKWKLAADAAKAIMDLNRYSIGTATGAAAFRNVFINRKFPEVIFAYQRAKGQDVERDNSPIGFSEPAISLGVTSPTQQLIDSYPTLNGREISQDPRTTANPDGFDPANPYEKRDPRLDMTVFFNGSRWLSRAVETFEGGLDKPNRGAGTQTRTGYYMKKFMADFSTSTAYSNQDHNFIIFRYAEILLNYAEAMNELSAANTLVARTQLIALRKRAGIKAGTNGMYGLNATMTQSEMRDAIRLERRLELAFEEHRFWDVRRWKLAEQLFNQQLKGVKITRNGSAFSYEYINVRPILFSARMYRYPIPFQEILQNKALVQNPGY